MREYERTSQIRNFSQLRPSLQQTIQHHIETHELNESVADLLMCIETVSQRLPGSFWTRLKSKLSGATERASAFLGLGTNEDATRFKTSLRTQMQLN
jgi:hypothetical protein